MNEWFTYYKVYQPVHIQTRLLESYHLVLFQIKIHHQPCRIHDFCDQTSFTLRGYNLEWLLNSQKQRTTLYKLIKTDSRRWHISACEHDKFQNRSNRFARFLKHCHLSREIIVIRHLIYVSVIDHRPPGKNAMEIIRCKWRHSSIINIFEV